MDSLSLLMRISPSLWDLIPTPDRAGARSALRFRSIVLGGARFSREHGRSVPLGSARFSHGDSIPGRDLGAVRTWTSRGLEHESLQRPQEIVRFVLPLVRVKAWCASPWIFTRERPPAVSAHVRRRLAPVFSQSELAPAVRGIFLIVAEANHAHRRASGTPRVTPRDSRVAINSRTDRKSAADSPSPNRRVLSSDLISERICSKDVNNNVWRSKGFIFKVLSTQNDHFIDWDGILGSRQSDIRRGHKIRLWTPCEVGVMAARFSYFTVHTVF